MAEQIKNGPVKMAAEQTEKIFFNVLPPEDGENNQATATEVSPVVTTELKEGHHIKIVMIIGLVLLALVLSVAGFFGYRYIAKKWQSTATNQQPNNKPETPKNDQPQQTIGVTTSTEWQKRFFDQETCADIGVCGDEADPDRDGLKNLEEFQTQTDPNNPDSDVDGLSDGDEAHIFETNPLLIKSYASGDYTDLDFVGGGYDIKTNEPYTANKLTDVKAKIKEKGLHQPSIGKLGAERLIQYDFIDPNLTPDIGEKDLQGIDQSPEAKVDRDAQRTTTIKKIGSALLKYKVDHNNKFPEVNGFNAMASLIKPYNSVATNFNDPINKGKYIYSYSTSNNNGEFVLTYFSETQSQEIKYTSKDAEIYAIKESSAAYDAQRISDLENIHSALRIYSDAHTDPNSQQKFVFPPEDKLVTELVPQYLNELPKDPRTGKAYDYGVNPTFDTYTLKALLDAPPKGSTGYLCNQEECRNY